MHKYMQVQSYLFQLGVKDLKGTAKDLGCSQSEVEGEKVGKKLVTLIELRLKDQLKLQGTTEDKIEHLEECKTQIVIYSPKCPSLEKPALGNYQSPPENGKHEINDTKQKFEESKQKLVAGKSFYFQPSDFKTELKITGQIGELGQKEKLSFVSLARQLEGAINKVYKSWEVLDAVLWPLALG